MLADVPLNAEVRTALDAWLEQRKKLIAQHNEAALFLTKQGTRLAIRTIDDVVRRLGQDAGLSLSAHILRHTCLTSLVRRGNDLVLVPDPTLKRTPLVWLRQGAVSFSPTAIVGEIEKLSYFRSLSDAIPFSCLFLAKRLKN